MWVHVCVCAGPATRRGLGLAREGGAGQATSRALEGLPARPTHSPKATLSLPPSGPRSLGIPGCPCDDSSLPALTGPARA